MAHKRRISEEYPGFLYIIKSNEYLVGDVFHFWVIVTTNVCSPSMCQTEPTPLPFYHGLHRSEDPGRSLSHLDGAGRSCQLL